MHKFYRVFTLALPYHWKFECVSFIKMIAALSVLTVFMMTNGNIFPTNIKTHRLSHRHTHLLSSIFLFLQGKDDNLASNIRSFFKKNFYNQVTFLFNFYKMNFRKCLLL